jgi:hypothetical protein
VHDGVRSRHPPLALTLSVSFALASKIDLTEETISSKHLRDTTNGGRVAHGLGRGRCVVASCGVSLSASLSRHGQEKSELSKPHLAFTCLCCVSVPSCVCLVAMQTLVGCVA